MVSLQVVEPGKEDGGSTALLGRHEQTRSATLVDYARSPGLQYHSYQNTSDRRKGGDDRETIEHDTKLLRLVDSPAFP